jgi:site-specific DNA recombinase
MSWQKIILGHHSLWLFPRAYASKGYRTKRGAVFGKNSLYEILRNKKYSGVYIYNKSAAKKANGKFNRHQSKNDEEIIKIDSGIPEIISKEDFAKVQQKMSERKRKTAAFKAKQEYLLTGKIVCGECGCTYAGNSRKASKTHPLYISYRCTKKTEPSSVKIRK